MSEIKWNTTQQQRAENAGKTPRQIAEEVKLKEQNTNANAVGGELSMAEQTLSTGVEKEEKTDLNIYTPEVFLKQQEQEAMPDYTNEWTALQQALGYINYSMRLEDFEFKKDKNGKITDIYPKKADKSNDQLGTQPDRYALRYDAEGNLVKTFVQDIDENGNVRGQEIKEYNKDGSLKNTTYYKYQYDENGEQTGQTRLILDAKYGDESQALAQFGITLTERAEADMVPPIGMNTPYFYPGVENVQRDASGRITELFYNNERYMLRYDSQGNVSKLITQSFVGTQRTDDNVSEQRIKELDSKGNVTKDVTHAYYQDVNRNRQHFEKNNLDSENENKRLSDLKNSIQEKIDRYKRSIEQFKNATQGPAGSVINPQWEIGLRAAQSQMAALNRLLGIEVSTPINLDDESNIIN